MVLRYMTQRLPSRAMEKGRGGGGEGMFKRSDRAN